MKRPILFSIYLIFSFLSILSAQEPFPIDTSKRSLYSGFWFGEELYRFSGDEQVEQMVDDICRVSGKARKFEMVNANVPNVAAVLSGKSAYLLYDRRFFFENRLNRTLLYAILSQEIGHLVRGHTLDGRFRQREETEADEFMGQVLMRLDSSARLDIVLAVVRTQPFSYTQIPWAERESAIRRGWERASALMEGPGFGVNETNIEALPLPRFQPKGCPDRIPLNKQRFVRCRTLRDVDSALCRALDAKGYTQRSYFCVKGGFALVTGIEQFQNNGKSVSGDIRWQDCPRKSRFDGVMDYLTSLVWPRPARFRVFVFVVTDQPGLEYEKGCINSEQAKEWLREGGDWLPESLANQLYTRNHTVRALVYEFRAPESTQRIKEECQERVPVQTHLEQSGILAGIKS